MNTSTNTSTGSSTGDTTETTPGNSTGTSTGTTDDGDTLDWRPCDDEEAPFECAELSVPLDYDKPDDERIIVAVNRLPAAQPDQREGAIFMNPGGPGGSGRNIANAYAYAFPQSILDRFDILGFDPRGVELSHGVHCDGSTDPGSASLRACIGAEGVFLSYVGTPNVARDMDAIRAAMGDDTLSYLGYSYGTALGGVYANMFPTHVRAMVLDGDVDPAAGKVNATKDYGDDFYADQDFDGVIHQFATLCDETSACILGPHSEDDLFSIYDTITSLPTVYFDGSAPLSTTDFDDVVLGAMYSVQYWPMLAVAIEDAVDGDASTLAALDSYMKYGYPAAMEAEPNFDFANLAIRCADFAGRGPDSPSCSDFPITVSAIPEIKAARGAVPIVTVGTRGDPATPWKYSGAMAKALGNGAVSITWEGAGHTATFTDSCITDAVIAYLSDLTVPPGDLDCPFVPGAKTDAEIADTIFAALGTGTQMDRLDTTLVDEGATPEQARCVGSGILATGETRLIVHELLGVQSPDLIALRDTVEATCSIGS